MSKALIVVDVQNDFCPNGALPVPGGDEIVPGINAIMDEFDFVILSQDWHPANHSSFASQHPGKNPMETIQAPYGPQVLWPDHCVQGTFGAEFHADLNMNPAKLILRKGTDAGVDSYSTFIENDKITPTGLSGYLDAHRITDLTFVGLATDFCVAWSALDAVDKGFETQLRLDLTRGIDVAGSLDQSLAIMRDAGVTII